MKIIFLILVYVLLSLGRMTSRYSGVQYWTEYDTIKSPKIRKDEMEAFEFVKNITNAQVVCDKFDPRYHTTRSSIVQRSAECYIHSTAIVHVWQMLLQ